MGVLLGVVHAFLYMLTLALTYAYYVEVNVDIPDWAYLFLGIAVIGVSLVIAIGHVIGGGLMGMTAGGILNGMRLGIMLGLSVSLGRLWPYMLIISVVAFIAHAPTWHWVTSMLLGLLFLGINLVTKFLWHRVT